MHADRIKEVLTLTVMGAGLFAQSLFACAPEAFPGQLVGRYPIAAAANTPGVLLAVKQYGQDLKVYVDGANPYWLNSPGGRYGTDYVFAPTGIAVPTELCLYASYQNSATDKYTISELDVAGISNEQVATLGLLNSAGKDWAEASEESVLRSAATFAELARSGFIEALGDNALAFNIRFSLAASKIRAGQNVSALADLQLLALDFRAQPEFAYKALWFAGAQQLQPANVTEGITQLEQALVAIDSAGAMTGVDFLYDKAEIEIDLGEGYITAQQLETPAAILDAAQQHAGTDHTLLAAVFANKGYLSIKRSEAAGISRKEKEQHQQQATDEHLLAIYFSEQAGNRARLQINESNMAVHYARIGERRKSLVHFLNVLRLLDETNNPGGRAFLYSTLGDYSQILGDYETAVAYLQESLRLVSDPATANPRNLNLYCRLGTLYRLLGRTTEAQSAHQTCLQLAVGVDDFMSRVEGHLQLSIDMQASGDIAAAEAASRESLNWLDQAGDLNISRRAWTQYAAVLFTQQHLPEADEAIANALRLERDQRQPDDKVKALTLALQIKQALGDIDAALDFGRQASELIQQLYDELEVERLGPSWSNVTNAAYAALTELYLDQYAEAQDPQILALALETTERARDPSLRQRLATQLSNDSNSLEEQKQLELYSKISSVLAAAGADQPLPLQTLDYYYQHDLLSLARLNNVSPMPVPAPLSLTELQARITPQQLVLNYLLTNDSLYVFTLTNASLDVRKLARAGRLDELLATAENLLHTQESFSLPLLTELSGYLLPEDMSAFPAAREVLIVSHASLYAFPFAALPLPAAAESYVPLISQYTLNTVPSLSAYFMAKPAREIRYSAEVAVIANPVFEQMQFAAATTPATGNAQLRGWSDSLQALPYTAEEAHNIEAIVPGRILLFTGTSATRANLSSAEVRNSHVLHIATHGFFKSVSEDNIGLALSTVDEQGDSDPGFITLTELFGNAFNNELVVISGCDTAMGKEQAGVGLNSLSRGFLAQGVKHVIATLWPVSDRASAEFMRLFYGHLQESKNVTVALQQAQLDLSRNPSYRNPYYWAGYTLTSVSPDASIELAD